MSAVYAEIYQLIDSEYDEWLYLEECDAIDALIAEYEAAA